MSHVTQTELHGVIAVVTTDTGVRGFGEFVPAPRLCAGQADALHRAHGEALSALLGQPVEQLLELAATLRARGIEHRGTAFGVETAYYDLITQAARQPFGWAFGNTETESLDSYLSISEATTDAILQRLRTVGQHHRVIQLKVGIKSLEEDLEAITAVIAELGSEQVLLADANGAWDLDTATQAVAGISDTRVLIEEPCRSYEDNLRVSQQAPVLFDQCIADRDAALQAMADGVSRLCIKPAFLGGLSVAADIARRASSAGVTVRVDGPWCGDIATAAIAHLATTIPASSLLCGCDLREPLTLPIDLGVVQTPRAGSIAVPARAGLGVVWDERY